MLQNVTVLLHVVRLSGIGEDAVTHASGCQVSDGTPSGGHKPVSMPSDERVKLSRSGRRQECVKAVRVASAVHSGAAQSYALVWSGCRQEDINLTCIPLSRNGRPACLFLGVLENRILKTEHE